MTFSNTNPEQKTLAEIRQEAYEKGYADENDEELQRFAQWLWDSHYLVDEAFTIRLVEQYKEEKN